MPLNNTQKLELSRKARTIVDHDRSHETRARVGKSLVVARPIIDELAKAGYNIETLSELRHLGRDWKTAIPILLRWLPLVDQDLGVKEDIVRCLTVPWTGRKATAELIEEFRKYASIDPRPAEDLRGLSTAQFIKKLKDVKRRDPSASLAWAIGNALSVVDVRGFEKHIVEVCLNRKYGEARQMVVLGLGRLKNREAEEAAVDLLQDEDVKLQAISALGRMRSKRSLFELERLLKDKRAVIRNEARKAITKIMR